MIENILLETFGDLYKRSSLDQSDLICKIEMNKKQIQETQEELESKIPFTNTMRKRKYTSAEIVKLVRKVFEDHTANIEEYI